MTLTTNADYQFCPHCGARLAQVVQFGRKRPTCVHCGFVHFHDPKVAVIGFVTWRDRVLLIRRGVEPMKGKWALPGGFMDAGEMPQPALARELAEEVGLHVAVTELIDIFPMTGPGVVSRGIVLAFAVALEGAQPPRLVCEDDALEAGWFRANELPEDLAFDSTHALLAQWRQSTPGAPTARSK